MANIKRTTFSMTLRLISFIGHVIKHGRVILMDLSARCHPIKGVARKYGYLVWIILVYVYIYQPQSIQLSHGPPSLE